MNCPLAMAGRSLSFVQAFIPVKLSASIPIGPAFVMVRRRQATACKHAWNFWVEKARSVLLPQINNR